MKLLLRSGIELKGMNKQAWKFLLTRVLGVDLSTDYVRTQRKKLDDFIKDFIKVLKFEIEEEKNKTIKKKKKTEEVEEGEQKAPDVYEIVDSEEEGHQEVQGCGRSGSGKGELKKKGKGRK